MKTVTQSTTGQLTAPELAKFIDHTLLKPDATIADYKNLCAEAVKYAFYSVCVPPQIVPLAKHELRNSKVKICTVVGFPFGYNASATKAFEAKCALDQGAHEIDTVINISALKSGENSIVLDDIRSVVRAAPGLPVKVIFETCYLNLEQKKLACELAIAAGAKFFKTSTGFGSGGATEEDIKLLVEMSLGKMGVKASGGIRDTQTALKMIQLGATRLGTSHSIAIVSENGTSKVAETSATSKY